MSTIHSYNVSMADQPTDKLDLSVIAVCPPEWLEAAKGMLSSLAQQQNPNPFEVVIVLDGHPEGDLLKHWKLLCMALPFPVQLFSTESTHRTGDKQRDIGIRKARGTYLTFLDDDDQPTPWYVTEMVAVAQTMGEDDVLGIVATIRAGYVLGNLERTQISGQNIVVKRAAIGNTKWESRTGATPPPGHEDYATDWFFIDTMRGKQEGDVAISYRVCVVLDGFRALRPGQA